MSTSLSRLPGERVGAAVRPGEALAIVLGALILSWPAFLNGFPLVFADTGTYLGQARLFYLGWDRPPFYSFFLRAVDWDLSLWTPVIVQAAITAHLLFLTLRSLGRRGLLPLLGVCLALAAATSLPWVTAELIADVFTGLVVLAFWLLGFGAVGRWERVYLVFFTTGAIAVHVSHVPFALGLLFVAAVLAWYGSGWRTALVTARRLALPPVLAVAAIMLVNVVGHGSPSLSPYGSVFYAARLIGDGTAPAYLETACPTRRFAICSYLDQLGTGGSEFLWHRFPQMTGLGKAKDWAPEAKEIVRGTIAHDPMAVAVAAFDNTVRQFLHLRIGDGLNPWPNEPGPEPLIARFFPWELDDYQRSAQSSGKLKAQADALAPALAAVAWLGLAGMLAVMAVRRRDQPVFALCVLVLAAALGNALITGALSGVEHRYQARIAWLFVFVPVAVLLAAPPVAWARASRKGAVVATG